MTTYADKNQIVTDRLHLGLLWLVLVCAWVDHCVPPVAAQSLHPHALRMQIGAEVSKGGVHVSGVVASETRAMPTGGIVTFQPADGVVCRVRDRLSHLDVVCGYEGKLVVDTRLSCRTAEPVVIMRTKPEPGVLLSLALSCVMDPMEA